MQAPELSETLALLPRPLAVNVVRDVLARMKAEFQKAEKSLPMSRLFGAIVRATIKESRRAITPVINAAGILVHTNLGRAPLSEEFFDKIRVAVTGYTNLEFDLSTGKRGQRGLACESYLAELAGAEAATVVNNGAAALFLILNTLANRKRVLLSRGELVQIGGGFRIPDILKRAGGRLVEIGTTNITTLEDYERELDEKTGAILKVHKSNFRQDGFTSEASLAELIALGKKHDIPVINDLGSGVFIPTEPIAGYVEPTVQESVRAGADLTCFSGDKMLGGLQAGLIVGRADLVARLKKNPLFRTVRVDKIVFASLEVLLRTYLEGKAGDEVKLWRYLSRPVEELRTLGKAVLKQAGAALSVTLEDTEVYLGGGALPQQALPSVALAFSSDISPNKLLKQFRELTPPVIGRIENDRFLLDLKAIGEEQVTVLADAIQSVLAKLNPPRP